jgi:hypothetical protein
MPLHKHLLFFTTLKQLMKKKQMSMQTITQQNVSAVLTWHKRPNTTLMQ